MNRVINPEITHLIWQELWQEYLQRVPYAQTYVDMIKNAGGIIANDHIAFRSLRLDVLVNDEKINLGISLLEKIITQLGYQIGNEYFFPDKYLYARHYYHPQQDKFNLPKLFISELIIDKLPEEIQKLFIQTVQTIKPEYKPECLSSLASYLSIKPEDIQPQNIQPKTIFTRPWQPPYLSHIQTINQISQYGAWVLLHGYAVNHFTAYINQQNTPLYPNIETTAKALENIGVPMKKTIEGSAEVGLRQTATQAVSENVAVIDDDTNQEIQIPWTYAYYEIAERYFISDKSGHQQLFNAFLGANAQHLFEMTKMGN